MKNLYIHFPFCETKCHYCDFFSLPEKNIAEDQQKHIYSSIVAELESFKSSLDSLETVFLGGGTPSLVPLEILEQLFQKVRLQNEAEVTIESNPSSVTIDKIRGWIDLGVNRVSMGMQALDDDRLKWLGRVHDKAEIFHALDAFFEAGISEISVDYILGVPGQSIQTIETELSSLLKQYPKINHLSAYLLTLKNSNPHFSKLPHEEEQLDHLRAATRVLNTHGFTQYEVSNFCKNGKTARHNQNYWSAGGYLGIGPSAHSYWPADKKRTKNWASLGKYVELVAQKQNPIEWDEVLGKEEQRMEFLLLGLRKSTGINLENYNQSFGQNLYQEKAFWIDQFVEKKLCKIEGNLSAPKTLKLTEEGFYLSDQIISKIV